MDNTLDEMDRPQPTRAVPTTPAPFDDDDPRATFGRAVALATAAIGAVRPDQLADPTPCPDFDVRSILAHLVEVLGGVAAVGEGRDRLSVQVDPSSIPDDGWRAAWLEAAHEVQRVWSDDELLTRMLVLPWTTTTGAAALAMYTNEVTVHTWDLARATGQTPLWDDSVLEVALAAIQEGLPATDRAAQFQAVRDSMPPEAPAWSDPFAEAVPVRDDAPLIERLVAWNGRTP